MIIDSRLELCNATALNTGAADRYLIGNQIDLSQVRDIGAGEPVYVVGLVETAIAGAPTSKVTFSLVSDAQAAVDPDLSTVHFVSPTFDAATGVAKGTVLFAVALPIDDYEQFLGVVQETAAAAVSAGKVDIFLTRDVAKWKAYAEGA